MAFLAVSSLVILIGLLAGGKVSPVEARLNEGSSSTFLEDESNLLGDEPPSFKLTSLVTKLMTPTGEDGKRRIGDRLIHAGLYKRGSFPTYVVTRVLTTVAPLAIGMVAATMGLMTMKQGVVTGIIMGLVGAIVPGLWLDAQRKQRQTNIRRALPDALDVIIVCVEGGLSLPAAFAKVSNDLQSIHPMLASEMLIVQREIQMGRSTGEALRNFANRFDLEELRGLASVVLQAERFGSSVVKALRVHADSLREKRQAQAEEMAAKAAVKVLIPTLLLIFPALFVVVLGPAVFDILELFDEMDVLP
jgi:tight adherence protein C